MWAPGAGGATGAAGYPTGEMVGFYVRGFEASKSERQGIQQQLRLVRCATVCVRALNFRLVLVQR